jgi:hypothetical protein
VWLLQRRESSLAHAGNWTEFLGYPAHSLGTILNDLSQLPFMSLWNVIFILNHNFLCHSASFSICFFQCISPHVIVIVGLTYSIFICLQLWLPHIISNSFNIIFHRKRCHEKNRWVSYVRTHAVSCVLNITLLCVNRGRVKLDEKGKTGHPAESFLSLSRR